MPTKAIIVSRLGIPRPRVIFPFEHNIGMQKADVIWCFIIDVRPGLCFSSDTFFLVSIETTSKGTAVFTFKGAGRLLLYALLSLYRSALYCVPLFVCSCIPCTICIELISVSGWFALLLYLEKVLSLTLSKPQFHLFSVPNILSILIKCVEFQENQTSLVT